MAYAGFYINLDRRTDRRAEIEAELARRNLTSLYERFPAIAGEALGLPHKITPGEMGRFSSHYMLLKQNLGADKPLHIIEDDVIFATAAPQIIAAIAAQNLFSGCDIVYTDIFVPIQLAAYKAYKSFCDATPKGEFNIVDLKGLPFGSTSSYLVNPASIRKLHDLYEAAITSTPAQSNDLFIRDLSYAGTLKVGCLFPFVTSVRLDHILSTDIDRSYHQASALAAHLGRYTFFADADFGICHDYIKTHLPPPVADDGRAQILTSLLSFALTDNYRSF
ncbi:MAG: glycosyltransferase family 25 protein [Alphaproteobacteria bacterium]|nr:glycosyltransferase family 25 protein [Alphaproteobacteria bacterium]